MKSISSDLPWLRFILFELYISQEKHCKQTTELCQFLFAKPTTANVNEAPVACPSWNSKGLSLAVRLLVRHWNFCYEVFNFNTDNFICHPQDFDEPLLFPVIPKTFTHLTYFPYFFSRINQLENHVWSQVRIQGGGPGGPGPPLDPRFWGPKFEHFWALFNFSLIFFCLASLGILFL